MKEEQFDDNVLTRLNVWLDGDYDDSTKKKIRDLKDNNPTEIIDAFYRDLGFGTGGLRGIMGVGTNRMNKYTVGMATQGLANYLITHFGDSEQIKVAIAYDCRNNNTYFSDICANVLSANNIKVFVFDALRPTPELSFAIRHLNCHSGIVITASHNPKEYNGYKVYWDDGAQLVNPHDVNVIKEANKINNIDEVKFQGNKDLIELIGKEIDDLYIKQIKALSLSPEIIEKHKNLKIVYTPIHGTGVKLVPESLRAFGFENIISVDEQNIVDGNFPTVDSPNPEEPEALKMAIQKAINTNASLVMATDPDADRVGIAVRDSKNEFELLNGNQTAAILIYYILKKWEEKDLLKGKEYIVKTIVTSEILKDIAIGFNTECLDVLTGFKFIADIIKKNEGEKTYIAGGEESYGYLIGDFVRDKDAVSSCCMIAEAAAWAADQGKTLYELLIEIHLKFGFYQEELLSIVRKGKAGTEEIAKMMDDFRNSPMDSVNNSKVVKIKDFLFQKEKNLIDNIEMDINLPKSNVIQFFLEDGSKITMRPSGTEPKIKFYFSVNDKLNSISEYSSMKKKLDGKIKAIIQSLSL